jgi:hypothetical protein
MNPAQPAKLSGAGSRRAVKSRVSVFLLATLARRACRGPAHVCSYALIPAVTHLLAGGTTSTRSIRQLCTSCSPRVSRKQKNGMPKRKVYVSLAALHGMG